MVEVVKLVSQERELHRSGEHEPVPQVLGEFVEVERLRLLERVRARYYDGKWEREPEHLNRCTSEELTV